MNNSKTWTVIMNEGSKGYSSFYHTSKFDSRDSVFGELRMQGIYPVAIVYGKRDICFSNTSLSQVLSSSIIPHNTPRYWDGG
jgi:hypothetical protein